jgi:hypothetical protein
MMKVKATDIQWDVDDKELLKVLPQEVIVECPDDADLNEELADILSDEYGFCLFGCSFEVI